MTIHKSQGSEFAEVIVILPAEENPILTRELVYTAITRAKSRVYLVASKSILEKAITTPTRRHTGLREMLESPDG
jgi:exodeoxyribonuclease V alpha subunit